MSGTIHPEVDQSSSNNHQNGNVEKHHTENGGSSKKEDASSPLGRRRIAVLPQSVVDLIAAGEVVQSAVSVIKELLENALDAGASEIRVLFSVTKLQVSDNGHGIPRDDLSRAVIRHATSKLRTVDDFSHLNSLGFRGEALASIHQVAARLDLHSRTRETPVGYLQSFEANTTQTKPPRPRARAVGTTVTVQDLFYNLPHRRKQHQQSRAASEEYNKLLQLVQHYAMLFASRGVTFCCERQRSSASKSEARRGATGGAASSTVDLNTLSVPVRSHLRRALDEKQHAENPVVVQELQQRATRHVIGLVYGTQLAAQLEPFSCHWNNFKTTPPENLDDTPGAAPTQGSMDCWGFCSHPSSSSSSSTSSTSNSSSKSLKKRTTVLVLFVNQRLVECRPLQRCIEQVYATLTNTNDRPFCFWSLTVPPTTVDVNVHPTKRHVTLLFLDEICQALTQALQQHLVQLGHSFAVNHNHKNNKNTSHPSQNALQRNKLPTVPENVASRKRPLPTRREEEEDDDDDEDYKEEEDDLSTPSETNGKDQPVQKNMPRNARRTSSLSQPNPQSSQQALDMPASAHKLIRTNHRSMPRGALEPYVVRLPSRNKRQRSQTDAFSQETTMSTSSSSSNIEPTEEGEPQSQQSNASQESNAVQHEPTCPLATQSSSSLDLSVPGAFAMAAKSCTCRTLAMTSQQRICLPPQVVARPTKIVPTPCRYVSIQSLRASVKHQADHKLQAQLRTACWVGVATRHRSLLQVGESLVLFHHGHAARELFYQLALAHFAGATKARVGVSEGGIDVRAVIAQLLHWEERLGLERNDHQPHAEDQQLLPSSSSPTKRLPMSDTNETIADQAATCLLHHAEMLDEYFAIGIREQPVNDEVTSADALNTHAEDTKKKQGRIVLCHLPVLLDHHVPCQHGLPLFLLRLATEVDWSQEKACFKGICRELATFYASLPSSPRTGPVDNSNPEKDEDELVLHHHVRHILFPALSTLLVPSQRIGQLGYFQTLTTLTKLYRVFERC